MKKNIRVDSVKIVYKNTDQIYSFFLLMLLCRRHGTSCYDFFLKKTMRKFVVCHIFLTNVELIH